MKRPFTLLSSSNPFYGWFVVLLFWTSHAIYFFNYNSLGVLGPLVKEGLTLNNTQFGLLFSTIFIGTMIIQIPAGIPSLKEEGGDLVIIANEPAGQVVHYLFGEFGKYGERRFQLPQPLPTKVKRFIVLSPFKDHVGACFFGQVPSILWVKTWKEALDLLKAEWGNKANVAIYPDGTIQYFP